MLRKRLPASGIFQKTFLSYFAILMIPVLVFTALGVHRNFKEERSRLYDKRMADAQRTSDIVDNQLTLLQNAGKVLSEEAWVRKRMESSDVFEGDFDVMNMMAIKKDLQNLLGPLSLVSFGAIVYPQKHLVISPWGSYSERDFFSNVAVFNRAALRELLSAAAAYRYFDIGKPMPVRLWGNDKKVIPVLQSLEVVGRPRAVLLLFIDSGYLAEFLERYGGVSGSFAISANDSVAYRHAGALSGQPDRQGRLEFRLASQASEWQYTFVYEDESLVGLRNVVSSLLAILISAIAGAAAAFGLAKVSCRPLAALLQRLTVVMKDEKEEGTVRPRSEYVRIVQSFERLLHENRSMRQAMSDYESAARSNLLLRLLKGCFLDGRQFVNFRKFGIGYSEDMHYCTILLRFHGFRDCMDIESIRRIEMFTIIVAEQVFRRHSLDYELFEVTDADKAVIVSFASPPGDPEALAPVAKELADEIERASRARPDIRHGAVEKGLIGISKSYYEANESLQMAIFMREHLQAAQVEAVRTDGRYYYPTDWEIQLINNLKVGNLDTSVRILSEIRAENARKSLPEASGVRLVTLLMETMLRVITEMNIDPGIYARQFESRAAAADSESMWAYVFEVATVICERIQYANTPHAMEAGNKLLRYVNAHYTEADVSLKTLAAKFGMSVSGVSKTFKEVAGVNFYDYLCRLRMERAKELLRERTCGIENVASRVGYDNVYSFQRAFVRYEGIRPKEYVRQ